MQRNSVFIGIEAATLPTLKHSQGLLPWLALFTTWIVWGSTYLAIRKAVDTIPPLTMAGIRFVVAGAVMYAIVGPRHARGAHRPTLIQLRSAVVVGALLLLGGNGLLSVGEQHLASGLSALLVATVPIWMVVINAALTRTRITRAMLLGVALGTAGVAVLIGWRGGAAINLGSAGIVLFASVSWAFGSVYARRVPLPRHPLVVTSLEMIGGGLVMLVVAGLTGEFGRFDAGAISGASLLGWLWLIVPGSMLGFTAYVYANSTLPNDVVATYAYVNPVIAVLLGVLIGQESFSANLVAGGAIIVSSVAIIVSGHRRSRPQPAAVAPVQQATLSDPA
jgi:drug/metabolite transporter (DMT)-like permease